MLAVALPLLMVAAIVAPVWFPEDRPDVGGRSLAGEKYGAVDLPSALVPPGMEAGPKEGKLAPDFLLETLDGKVLRLSDLRGKPVIINFWATWCPPCRREIPDLIAVHNRYRDLGLVLLGVNLAESDGVVRPFTEEFGMDFPVLMDRSGGVAREYRVLGLPTTYFVDGNGVVRSLFLGRLVGVAQGTNVQAAIEKGELERRVEAILP